MAQASEATPAKDPFKGPAPGSWQPGELIVGRYQLESCLAEGPSGRVYAARSLQNQPLILKVLDLHQLDAWEALGEFEREAAILGQLKHPRLPQLHEFMELETGCYCLVQSRLPGSNLKQQSQSWQPSEAELILLADQALQILNSLHQSHPPLIHRDIKPSNLLLDEASQLYLIDFGAAIRGLASESAVIGTPGYMPVEQYAGRAVPASDLYALGMTLIELGSGHSLSSLLNAQGEPDFRQRLAYSAPLLNWLEILAHPRLELRFESAAEAQQALKALPAAKNLSFAQITGEIGSQELKPEPKAGISKTGTLTESRILAGRYRLDQRLKLEGGVGTWLAQDTQTSEPVQIKLLDLSQLNSVKQLELFERELQVLQSLPELPTPKLLDVIQTAQEWALVLEQLEGQTLQQQLDGGWRASEDQIWQLAEAALQSLQILHQADLIHRDLRPENLLWQQDKVYLLNFGGVQQYFRLQGSGGSTVIGSFGYTPPEQLLGRAQPQSDLYALGVCLLQILTGQHPANLPWKEHRLDLTALRIPEALKRWLSSLLEPDLNKRCPSTQRALQALKQQQALRQNAAQSELFESEPVKQERLQQHQLQESRFRLGGSAYLANISDSWAQKLEALRLPLPPPRLELYQDPSTFRLTLPFIRPSKQPLLAKRLRLSKRLQKSFQLLVLPAIVGCLFKALLPLTFLCGILLLWLIQRAYRLRSPYFADLYLNLDSSIISAQAGPASSWQKELPWCMGPPKSFVTLKTQELAAIKLQPAASPAGLEGDFYQLQLEAKNGQSLNTAPCFLRPDEKLWLEQTLPVLLEDFKKS